jgi:hypothetical protein
MREPLDEQKQALQDLMKDLSEHHWYAGWMRELEYHLWDAVVHGPSGYGFAVLSEDAIATLASLSQAVGGWFYWSDKEPKGIQFVSLDAWCPRYARWAVQRAQRGGEDPLTLLPFAYTFDPQQFHQQLKEQVLRGDSLDHAALRASASRVVRKATREIKKVLEVVRYSPDWLQPPDKVGDYLAHWYLLTLMGRLAVAPAHQKSLAVTIQVLEELVPLAGWTPDEIGVLIYGQPLHTLVDASENHLFKEAFSLIDQLGGGWLSLDLSQSLLSRLVQSEALFASPPGEALDKFSTLARLWGQTPVEMSQAVFSHARAMLETSVDRKQALLLLLGDVYNPKVVKGQ